MVDAAIKALIAQSKEFERDIAALDLKAIEFEGSDSLDKPKGEVGELFQLGADARRSRPAARSCPAHAAHCASAAAPPRHGRACPASTRRRAAPSRGLPSTRRGSGSRRSLAPADRTAPRPSAGEEIPGGAATNASINTRDAFSHFSHGIGFEGEPSSRSATPSSASCGCRRPPRPQARTGSGRSITRGPARAATSRTGAGIRPRPTSRRQREIDVPAALHPARDGGAEAAPGGAPRQLDRRAHLRRATAEPRHPGPRRRRPHAHHLRGGAGRARRRHDGEPAQARPTRSPISSTARCIPRPCCRRAWRRR